MRGLIRCETQQKNDFFWLLLERLQVTNIIFSRDQFFRELKAEKGPGGMGGGSKVENAPVQDYNTMVTHWFRI